MLPRKRDWAAYGKQRTLILLSRRGRAGLAAELGSAEPDRKREFRSLHVPRTQTPENVASGLLCEVTESREPNAIPCSRTVVLSAWVNRYGRATRALKACPYGLILICGHASLRTPSKW